MSRLYTYLPKDNTALQDGILSTVLTDKGFEKYRGLPEKKAYELGFIDKLAERGMTKQAKNLTRLLARVGPNLAGASSRDLKFLARRGFKGFTPQQVQMLRARGMLPTIDQELAGFNRGTENMLRWTPQAKTPRPVIPPEPKLDIDRPIEEYLAASRARGKARIAAATWDAENYSTQPAKKITRTNDPTAHYLTNLRGRELIIPDTLAPGTLAEREMRASTARHEAREWVRGNAQLSKGHNISLPGSNGFMGMFARPEVGSSHIPGVIYDERVFRSQLLNRLGSDVRWDKAPLRNVQKGKYDIRGARDSFVGNKPLSYEFDRIADWRATNRRQARELGRLRNSAFKQGMRGPFSPEMEKSVNELLSNPDIQAIGLTPQQARRLVAASAAGFNPHKAVRRVFSRSYLPVNTKAGISSDKAGIFSEKAKLLKIRLKLEEMLRGTNFFPDEVPELISRTPAYRELNGALQGRGLSFKKYKDILSGDTIDVPGDSVLGEIRNMSFYPNVEYAKKLPDLIPRKPSIFRRFLSRFGIG